MGVSTPKHNEEIQASLLALAVLLPMLTNARATTNMLVTGAFNATEDEQFYTELSSSLGPTMLRLLDCEWH